MTAKKWDHKRVEIRMSYEAQQAVEKLKRVWNTNSTTEVIELAIKLCADNVEGKDRRG